MIGQSVAGSSDGNRPAALAGLCASSCGFDSTAWRRRCARRAQRMLLPRHQAGRDARGGRPPGRGAGSRCRAGAARRPAGACRAGPARRATPSRGWATSSAAAVGVGARRSAQKSAMVKSVSWPTPLTSGTGLCTMVRASCSSLKAHRSSIEPPPRTSKITSIGGFRAKSAPGAFPACASRYSFDSAAHSRAQRPRLAPLPAPAPPECAAPAGAALSPRRAGPRRRAR